MFKELQLIITTKCSLACAHCNASKFDNNIKDLLIADDYVFLVETINKLFNYNRITLMGGDPFVRNDIEDIIQKLNNLDIDINVYTNGSLLSKHMDIIKTIDALTVSIKTMNEEKYNKYIGKNNIKFDKFITNLLSIRNQNKKLAIDFNTKITKDINDSVEEITELINLSKKMRADIYIQELMSEDESVIVPIKEVINIFKKHNYVVEKDSAKETILVNGNKIIIAKNFCPNKEKNKYCVDSNSLVIYPNGKIKLCELNNNSVTIIDEIKNRDIEGLTSKLIMANNLSSKKCNMNKIKQDLAINGGKPIINPGKGIYTYPKITKELEKALIDTLQNNQSVIKQLIGQFTKYHNKKYGVLSNSESTAFYSLFKSLNFKSSDEIIIPAYISAINIAPIFETGATPIIVDTNETGNIDIKKIKEVITSNTKAIIVNHNYGYASEIDKVKELANQYNIYLIEDCTTAIGGIYKNQKLGSFGDVSVFNLNSTLLAGSEGGVILTNNKHIYINLLFYNYYPKILKEIIDEKSTDYSFINVGTGLNIKINPFNARLAYECFPNIDKHNRVRKFYASIINKAVEGIDGLDTIKSTENSSNSWERIIIKYDRNKFKVSIQEFVNALNDEGAIEFKITDQNKNITELSLFQKPNYFFKNYNEKSYNCPNATTFSKTTFKLPVWYDEEDINLVFDYCEVLKKVSNYYQRRDS